MDTTDTIRSPLGDAKLTLDGSAKPLSYFLTTILVIIFAYSMQGSKMNTPSINPKGKFELTDSRPKQRYLAGAREMMYSWFKTNPNKPVRLVSDMGETIVLPPSMANEIRNHAHLSFTQFAAETKTPGFDAFREGTRDSITLIVINKDLTKALAKVTEPLADETSLALRDIFTDSKADRLREWPRFMRPIIHWFMPGCQKARSQIVQAAEIIKPIIEKRRALKAAAIADGRTPPEFNDAIDWFEAASKGKHYDPAISQLFFSTVAIHTTTDLLGQVLVDIARNPEIIEPLRNEIMDVLSAGGWKKTSLYSMKLLDSVVKESQRMKPLQLASMQRVAVSDVTLSDGTFIPKGTSVSVSSHALFDANVYENPEKWDGYRFLRMREQPGKENVSQLVSTAPEHLGFGHGKHACPGRFFAANEIKIALVHILLQYEWRLPAGADTSIVDLGINPFLNPMLELEIRRREEEVDMKF
ncbi:Cytochrome P450 monooxygenase TRI1 [Colletotrichum sp. SAR 10_98]|nr:Cytochrome P450 monooxygenase TRI1 [Colletotrichum sp. SAR 10_98]